MAVMLTHGHYDHMLAADAGCGGNIRFRSNVHELDEAVLEDSMLNLSGLWSRAYTMKADRLVKGGRYLPAGGFYAALDCQGSVCYYFPEQKVLISGDTLFCQSYGRTDFPTSSMRDMQKSVRRLLTELPEDTAVYPGHEMATTIAMEKRYNPLA